MSFVLYGEDIVLHAAVSIGVTCCSRDRLMKDSSLPFSPTSFFLLSDPSLQTSVVQVDVNEFVVGYAAGRGICRFREFSQKLNSLSSFFFFFNLRIFSTLITAFVE